MVSVGCSEKRWFIKKVSFECVIYDSKINEYKTYYFLDINPRIEVS
jgi:hypothetical protein